jgi:hypothetical protein
VLLKLPTEDIAALQHPRHGGRKKSSEKEGRRDSNRGTNTAPRACFIAERRKALELAETNARLAANVDQELMDEHQNPEEAAKSGQEHLESSADDLKEA